MMDRGEQRVGGRAYKGGRGEGRRGEVVSSVVDGAKEEEGYGEKLVNAEKKEE